jgi:hypothetical protein
MRLCVSFLSFYSNSSALTLSRCNPYQGQQQAKESSSRANRVSTTSPSFFTHSSRTEQTLEKASVRRAAAFFWGWLQVAKKPN